MHEGMNACSGDLRGKTTEAVERGPGTKRGGAARTVGAGLPPAERYAGIACEEGGVAFLGGKAR